MANDTAKRKVYTVSEITRLVKSALENEFGQVWIEGEISNVRRPSSGHYYFTVKDESSQISAVLFRGSQGKLSFQLKDGLLVRIFGELTVYERGGNYQIIVRRVEEGGKGALQARFEALKEQLQKEGLFAEERKRPIPLLPQHIGIVTSPTGAAIKDILNVLSRRFPNVHILLAPVKVQGEAAAAEIADAIDALNRMGGLDVIIAGRGGGSLEDLWCFNEEIVARAIARSGIPVISAVGHEIDFTISDFVADLRAATPSAAAELVVGRKDAFEAMLADISRRIARSVRELLLETRNRMLALSGSYVFQEPGKIVQRYRQQLDGHELRIRNEVRGTLMSERQRLDDIGLRVLHETKMTRELSSHIVKRLDTQLKALNPLAVLERGYSVTSDENGNAIRSMADVSEGQKVATRVLDGTFESEIVEIKKNPGQDELD